MYNGLEPRKVYYDPEEKILLANRKNGKQCTFIEETDSYLLINGETGNTNIIKQISLEHLQSFSDIENIMKNVSSLKPPDNIRKSIDDLYNYLYDEVYPKHEIPDFADDYESQYIHVISYNEQK